MAYTYQYPRPAVTTDCVVFSTDQLGQKYVLLIRRKNEPYKDHWAFPGGFLEMTETADQCAIRELAEETQIIVNNVKQIGAFSSVDRDPRGRTITIAFVTTLPHMEEPHGSDDAAEAKWFALNNLPPLAFDHAEILNAAINTIHLD